MRHTERVKMLAEDVLASGCCDPDYQNYSPAVQQRARMELQSLILAAFPEPKVAKITVEWDYKLLDGRWQTASTTIEENTNVRNIRVTAVAEMQGIKP